MSNNPEFQRQFAEIMSSHVADVVTIAFWQRENDLEVSAKLDELRFDFDIQPRAVWEVVQELFNHDELELARKAQRFAVTAAQQASIH